MSNYNTGLKNRIFSLSPYVELIGRRLFYLNKKNLKFLAQRAQKDSSRTKSKLDLSLIMDYIKSLGVKKGSNLLIHSAYGPFKGRGYSPREIVDEILNLIGNEGTLAMPAMPHFSNKKELVHPNDKIDLAQVYLYDVAKSPISTGVLPTVLHEMKDSVRSRHPINSMVAIGPLKELLINDNLLGRDPLPCGINSSWKRTVDHDFRIISLGTDFMHSATSIHINEDTSEDPWIKDNWYNPKKFIIKDGEFYAEMILNERKEKWGSLHWAERTMCKDLFAAKVLVGEEIDGIIVETITSKDLFNFIKQKGFPYSYYWTGYK
jgi:aminoglycoside 3-N-acetyltransferase